MTLATTTTHPQKLSRSLQDSPGEHSLTTTKHNMNNNNDKRHNYKKYKKTSTNKNNKNNNSSLTETSFKLFLWGWGGLKDKILPIKLQLLLTFE